MGITIQQYRSRIGRFLPKHIRNSRFPQTSLVKDEDSPQIQLQFSWFCITCIAIFSPFILALQQHPKLQHTQQSYSHPLYPTADLQIGITSGTVTTDLHSRFILSYMINIFAASSFSMVTNYQSRYTYEDKESKLVIGIRGEDSYKIKCQK